MGRNPHRWSAVVCALALAAVAACDDGPAGSGAPDSGAGGMGGSTTGAGGRGGATGGGAGGATGGTGGATGGSAGGTTGGAAGGAGGSGGSSASDASPPDTNTMTDTASTSAPAPGSGTWEALQPMPATRQEFGVAELGGKIFVVGGLNPRANRVEAYDPATNQWAEHPNLPLGLDHPNVAAANGKLYVLGATQTGNTLEYDPSAADRRWVQKAPMPTHRAAAAVGVLGSRVFVAGGNGSGSTANPAFEIYDAAADSWQSSTRGELPPLPAGRNHVPGAVVDGRFYVIGGRLGGRFEGLQTRVDSYDPGTKQWSSGAPMPTPRGGSAAGVVNGFIVVVGGEGNSAPGNMGVFPQTELYDPRANRWVTLKPMMTPRHGMGAAGLNGKLYVPAGGTVDGGGNPVTTVEAFSF